MASSHLQRVSVGDVLRTHHINQLVDAVEALKAQAVPQPTSDAAALALMATACVASATSRKLSRRQILMPWRRR